jgi:hypothetical protein
MPKLPLSVGGSPCKLLWARGHLWPSVRKFCCKFASTDCEFLPLWVVKVLPPVVCVKGISLPIVYPVETPQTGHRLHNFHKKFTSL